MHLGLYGATSGGAVNSKPDVGFQYIMSGGYCILFFSAVNLLNNNLLMQFINWKYCPYATLLAAGGLLIMHLFLFDRLPRRQFVIVGGVCWILTFVVQYIGYSRF